METFKHQPFNNPAEEIRLLLIDRDTAVKCRLVHTSIRNNPTPYIALSYVWGDRSDTSTILVDDKPFMVTKSLFSFFQRKALPREGFYYWIDAICIDQNNIFELNQQVSMMREIYTSALVVFAWLGPAEDESNLAFDLIERNSDDWAKKKVEKASVNSAAEFRQNNPPASHPIFGTEEDDADPPYSRNYWFALNKLLSRPWFYRTWTFQEAIVGEQLGMLCGERAVWWKQIEDLIIVVRLHHCEYDTTVTADLSQISRIAAFRSDPQNRDDPFLLVEVCRWRKASNPRDKIYAFTGFARKESMAIDYGKRTEDVYHQFAIWSLDQSRNLKTLSHVRYPRKLENLPTWVPDWAIEENDQQSFEYELYSAAYSTRSSIVLRDDSKTLVVKGFQVDSISRIFENSSNSVLIDPDLTEWVISHTAYITGCSRREAYWRTSSADMQYDYGREGNVGKRIPRAVSVSDLISNSTGDDENVERSLRQLGSAKGSLGSGRLMCLSKQGYLLLGPNCCQTGDLICVLLGGRMPFVLHPQSSCYELVGECYMHGIMDGEVINEWQDGKIDLQEFSLR